MENELTVREALQLRKDLQGKLANFIHEIIIEFHDKTGIWIDEVKVANYFSQEYGTENAVYSFTDVTLRLNLERKA